MKFFTPSFTINKKRIEQIKKFIRETDVHFLIAILYTISGVAFLFYYKNGLGLSYNDARSHLDIGRRVVEGLKPGLAQLGSVWLPLPHILMIPTIWNDFMWHSGLAGALQSMISFIGTGVLVYLFLKRLGAGFLGRIIGVSVFVANINILYLQSTAMTELLLLFTMTAGVYMLLVWVQENRIVQLVYASFWIMLSTLIRYDGWFLLVVTTAVIFFYLLKTKGIKRAEGTVFFFLTLASLGVIMWFLWNLIIFKDPLYFAFGPYSAHAQQQQLLDAGVLKTKGNMLLSLQVYLYAMVYSCGAFTVFLAACGAFLLAFEKKLFWSVRIVSLILLAPLVFNILALYLGHSVLFIQGIFGGTWFNIRYGVMMMPSIAIFIGFLIDRSKSYSIMLVGLFIFVTFFSMANGDAVTIDDARVGSSQKNVSEVSGWLERNTKDKDGFILISAASHDAIIFSSGLPMSKFIHEGTGAYWESATAAPDRWARWIIMRTNDQNDSTFKLVNKTHALNKFTLVGHYPFADIYEIKKEYLKNLQTKQTFKNQK